MKKELQIKENEAIYKWIDRLAEAFNLTKEQKEMVREVSITSYTHGSNDAIEVLNATREKLLRK